jgi:hypothetical protein
LFYLPKERAVGEFPKFHTPTSPRPKTTYPPKTTTKPHKNNTLPTGKLQEDFLFAFTVDVKMRKNVSGFY